MLGVGSHNSRESVPSFLLNSPLSQRRFLPHLFCVRLVHGLLFVVCMCVNYPFLLHKTDYRKPLGFLQILYEPLLIASLFRCILPLTLSLSLLLSGCHMSLFAFLNPLLLLAMLLGIVQLFLWLLDLQLLVLLIVGPSLSHLVSLIHRPFLFPNNVQIVGHILQFPAERSEEHTSELQSRFDLVCRLLLEKKKYH